MTTFVIATWNLGERGFGRVAMQVYGINKFFPEAEVSIVDGSKASQYKRLRMALKGLDVFTVHRPQAVMNLPKLWNYGVRHALHSWIQISGADFLYPEGYLEHMESLRAPNRLLITRAKSLPPMSMSKKRIDTWDFPEAPDFPHGDLANGLQYASREFFLENPYEERMEKLGGMDNLMVYRAQRKGVEVRWNESFPALHQWHKPSAMKRDRQFERNQQIIREDLAI